MDDKKFQLLSKPQQDVVLKIAAEAERQGVNPKLAIAIAEAETGGKFGHFDKDKVLTSPAGARGVMQIMPDTAQLYNKKLGAEIDPDDEDSNIKGGVFILKDLLTKYKSPRVAVAMYNASPRANAEFVKQYEINPDAAIMSLKPETRKYSLRISQNFNLDDDNETGLIEAQAQAEPDKPASPFAGLKEEFAETKRLLEESKGATKEEEPADDKAPLVGAVSGAITNLLFPPMTNPETAVKVDTGKAKEANLTAQDKLELARSNLENAVPQGTENLEDTFRQSQGELERLRNEQRLAQERLKGIPKAAPVIEPPAPSSPFPQQVDAPSRTKAGEAGAVNWVHSMSDDVPDVVANKALNMRGDNPRGGQAIIDANMAAMQKQADLGLGDFGLTRTEGGVQLALPATTVAERQADIEKQSQANQAEVEQRAEQTRIQQETQARLLEQQRALYEYEMERLQQQRAQAGQRHNIIAGQTKAAAPLQKALTKAETDAEVARRKLARAQQQPNTAGRVAQNVGASSAKMGALPRVGVGAGAGFIGVMSYQEALARFKAGDTSEGVLQALQAGSAGAAMLPPAGKALTKTRGAGVLGTLGLGGYQLGRRLLKDSPPEE
jgi:soluble lytic murein transglycosylase-like protein